MIAELFTLKKKQEKWFILFPILAIAGAAIQILFFERTNTDTEDYIYNFIIYGFFLNITHVGFTFGYMFVLPESRAWIVDNFRSLKRFSFYLLAACVFFVGLIFLSFETFTGVVSIDKRSGLIMLGLIAMASVWHNYAQSMGLSLRYNYNIKEQFSLAPEETRRLNFAGKFERYGVHVIFIMKAFFMLEGLTWMVETFDWKGRPINAGYMAIQTGLILTMFWLNSRIPKVETTDKMLFGLRYLVWPFSGEFRTASYVFSAIHGIEYYFVCKRMGLESYQKPQERKRYYRMVALGGFFFFILTLFSIDSLGSLWVKSYAVNPLPIIILSSVNAGLFMIHFFWDRYFFRFRGKSNRETSGRLMLDLNDEKAAG